jgi:hypothetical protein
MVPREPRRLPILVRVLTLVGLVMPDDTPSTRARSSVADHMTGDSPDDGAFNAAWHPPGRLLQ